MILIPLVFVAFMWNGVHQSPYQGPHFEPGTLRPAPMVVVSK
ncbi:hypothetical protein HNP33_003431 [Comamonas odontotermitis]|uniref:Uncharacterized protein n=1 Tax=Comamonas odontotermitis TaxID=379895 RepID=A0ABR6RJK7_9BURK|nr:hypothetical protein [Comamonas odontotermitis]